MRFGIVNGSSASSNPRDHRNGENTTPATPEPLNSEHFPKIEAALGYSFNDYAWLERALTHRSAPEDGSSRSDYERIEFLGDAVFDLAVAHLLLDAHREAKEGELSKMRAALVNALSLADIARSIGIGPYIRLSRGELANGGADRPSILSDVMEALLGAVYRDGGYQAAFDCIAKLLGTLVQTVTPSDPKTELQEALHASGSSAPIYLLECTEGPEHSPTFISVVEVDGQIVGRGRGPTKKASQQTAAAEALECITKNDPIDSLFTAKG